MGIDAFFVKNSVVEKPREKAMRDGIEQLGDAELLALILDTGTKNQNVLELSEKILLEKGGLRGVFLSDDSLLTINGIGKAKSFRLKAIREIMKRLPFSEEEQMLSAFDAYKKTMPYFLGQHEEKLLIIYLTKDRFVLKKEELTDYKNEQVELNIRKIILNSISVGAKAVIVIHNHPSGDCNPSKEDINTSSKLAQRLLLAGVVLLDSIIVTVDTYYSFRKERKGPFGN